MERSDTSPVIDDINGLRRYVDPEDFASNPAQPGVGTEAATPVTIIHNHYHGSDRPGAGAETSDRAQHFLGGNKEPHHHGRAYRLGKAAGIAVVAVLVYAEARHFVPALPNVGAPIVHGIEGLFQKGGHEALKGADKVLSPAMTHHDNFKMTVDGAVDSIQIRSLEATTEGDITAVAHSPYEASETIGGTGFFSPLSITIHAGSDTPVKFTEQQGKTADVEIQTPSEAILGLSAVHEVDTAERQDWHLVVKVDPDKIPLMQLKGIFEVQDADQGEIWKLSAAMNKGDKTSVQQRLTQDYLKAQILNFMSDQLAGAVAASIANAVQVHAQEYADANKNLADVQNMDRLGITPDEAKKFGDVWSMLASQPVVVIFEQKIMNTCPPPASSNDYSATSIPEAACPEYTTKQLTYDQFPDYYKQRVAGEAQKAGSIFHFDADEAAARANIDPKDIHLSKSFEHWSLSDEAKAEKEKIEDPNNKLLYEGSLSSLEFGTTATGGAMAVQPAPLNSTSIDGGQ